MNSIFMAENLDRQIVKGVSWNLIETFSVYLSRFLIGVVLARILFPADIGLIAIITIFISISDVFVNAGFGQAFIYKKDASKEDADTIFVINLVIGLIIYAVLFFIAPYIASFFNQEILTSLIRVFSVIVIINAFNVIQNSIIRKEFQFKKRAIVTIIATFFGGGLGIFCAYSGLGVWSLVIQQLSNRLLLNILLYFSCKWRISIRFSMTIAKELFSYGSWILLANLFLTIFNNLYKFIIGKLYSDVQLGLYERAKQFESMIADTFTMVLGNVAFPVFSKLQNSTQSLEVKTNNFIFYSCMIIYPMLTCLIIVAKPFIVFLITDKWLLAVPYLRLLCMVGYLIPLNFFIGPLLQATGHPRKALHYTFILGLMRIANVALTFKYGVSGIIIGEFIILIIATIGMSIYIRPFIGFNYLSFLKEFTGLILVTGLAALMGYLLLSHIYSLSDFLQTVLPCLCIATIYTIWMIVFERAKIKQICKALISR